MSRARRPLDPVRLPQALTARLRGGGAYAAVLATAALAHLPSLFNGFVWDDLPFILGNPLLHDLRNLPGVFTQPATWGTDLVDPYYRPLTLLTFMTDSLLWGGSPAGFHATNVLMHLGVCALLLAVLRRLLAPGAALAAALLFAVHPAHAEPVAYVSARSDLICAFLLLASFLGWLRHEETRRPGALALSTLAYGAALLAKITAGPFPAVFALHALLVTRRRPRVRDLLPFAAVALLYLAVRGAVLEMDAWPSQPLLARIALAGPVLVRYALMAVSPAHLSVFHDLRLSTSMDATAVRAWLLLAAAVMTAAVCARQANRVVLGLAWFLAGLVPVSGLVTVLYPAPVADRYLYIPLLGAALAAGAGVQRFSALIAAAPRRRIAAAAAAAVVLALAGTTAWRGRSWRDSVALWEQAALNAHGNQYVLNALGSAYRSGGRDEEAWLTLMHSLEVNEASPDAHLNLAALAFLRNDTPAAEWHTLRALELAPGSPTAYRFLGRIIHGGGDEGLGLRAAERALQLNLLDERSLRVLAERRGSGVATPATANEGRPAVLPPFATIVTSPGPAAPGAGLSPARRRE